jgi:NitT/TauT family transport system permease protein
MTSRLKRIIVDAAPPAALLVLVLIAWDAAVVAFDLPRFLLPRPGQVAATAWSRRAALMEAVSLTGAAALCGFGISLALGVLVAVVFSQSAVIRRSAYPYAVFLQTVPIVAVAPLVVNWFGYGFVSVMVVASIISLFPIITGATIGMTVIEPGLWDLFQLHRASRWQILWKLRLPHAAPMIAAGAKISAGLAVVGAIVGEFFVGLGTRRYGLGYLVRQSSEQYKTELLFASVIAAALLGVAIFSAVSLIASKALWRWGGQMR